MSLLMKRPWASVNLLARGISRLSELQIDADKDWNGKGVWNLRELAQGMEKGDILYRGADRLVRLTPGPISYELTSRGVGNPVGWEPPPSP